MQNGPSTFSKAASAAYKLLPLEDRGEGMEVTKVVNVRQEAKKIFTRIGKEVRFVRLISIMTID